MLVRRFGQDALEGFVDPKEYLRSGGIEMMTRSAETLLIPYETVRAVYFVRDFGTDPEQNQRTEFVSRPKLGGLWIRLEFVDGDHLEGVIPNDLRMMGQPGVTLTPPDSKGQTGRVFVPGPALENLLVMGVIGKPARQPKGPSRALKAADVQMDLFSG